MKIKQFSQIGKRSNNEDSLGKNDVLLTVCDGMGGHNYGERASAFVVEHMLNAFSQLQTLGKTEIQQQLNIVQTDLNQLLEKEPELEKMGTTFTGIIRTPDVWYAAHIGDSRIYLFRPSEKKLWHSWDHSLVGELMRTHEITIEAGRFHPLSNRISKAVIAKKDGKPATASIVKIDELKDGDVLMLCSDGVVEAWGDWDLVQLFANKNLTFEQKCKKLAKQCNECSKDNNTAIIAEIEADDVFSYGANDELEWTSFDDVEADYQQYLRDNADDSDANSDVDAFDTDDGGEETDADDEADNYTKGRRNHRLLWAVILIVLAVAVLFFVIKPARTGKTKQDSSPKVKIEVRSRHKKENPKDLKAQNMDKKAMATVNEEVNTSEEKPQAEAAPVADTQNAIRIW